MTLGAAAAAGVRLIVWCPGCQHQVELTPPSRPGVTAKGPPFSIGASGWCARGAGAGGWIWWSPGPGGGDRPARIDGRRAENALASPEANVRRCPVGVIETSAALGACLLVLVVAVALDRRPYRPGKRNYVPMMIIAVGILVLGRYLLSLVAYN